MISGKPGNYYSCLTCSTIPRSKEKGKKKLLEAAKRTVEIAIEKDEKET